MSFRAGLQLLLAEDDNINRSIKVKGGLYTAKAKEGRFVFKTLHVGYRKQRERKERRLVVEETVAKIVRFIYDSYLGDIKKIGMIFQSSRSALRSWPYEN